MIYSAAHHKHRAVFFENIIALFLNHARFFICFIWSTALLTGKLLAYKSKIPHEQCKEDKMVWTFSSVRFPRMQEDSKRHFIWDRFFALQYNVQVIFEMLRSCHIISLERHTFKLKKYVYTMHFSVFGRMCSHEVLEKCQRIYRYHFRDDPSVTVVMSHCFRVIKL